MGLEYFNAYHSYLKSIEPLNEAERGRLFTALLIYSSQGEEPELKGNERFVFPMIKQQIDRDREKYKAKCQANKRNIDARWNTNVYDRIPNDTTVYERIQGKGKGKGKDKGEGKGKGKGEGDSGADAHAHFIPPSVEEVNAYCLERNNGIDAAHFVDYYTSNGWKVGKQNMKDWKAAVRTWERNGYSNRENKAFSSNNPFL